MTDHAQLSAELAAAGKRREHFPSTKYTLLGRWLREGAEGLAEARRHVMEVYARPLEIYYQGSSFGRRFGDEAGDVVRGFFADRLSRAHFLYDWLLSRRPLRYWLITAFRHHLYEQLKARGHDKRRPKEPPDTRTDEEPEAACHHEMALWMVREALHRAEAVCRRTSQTDHWSIALQHHLKDRSYRDLGAEFGISEKRAKVMVRTAMNKFKAALREIVAWPGATPEEIEQEIRLLMEVLET